MDAIKKGLREVSLFEIRKGLPTSNI
jgi:hypothetical protein